MTDPYAVLGLAPDATDDDRKKAFRKLAMQYHPDRNPGDKAAEAKFIEATNANDAIEKGWRPGMPPPGAEQPQPRGNPFGFNGANFHFTAGNVEDLFAAFTAHQRQRNHDFEARAVISLVDAFNGTEITLQIANPDENTRTLKVKVPAGIESGSRIRVPQAGDKTHASLKPGDLYLTVLVQPDERFQRQGPNLIAVQPIELFDMMLGTKVMITGIDQHEIAVLVPAGSRPDQQFRVSGMGMPVLNGNGARGDLFMLLDVVYPDLSEAQREKLAELRTLASA